MPLCPPQISQGLNWDRTRASGVRGKQQSVCLLKINVMGGFGVASAGSEEGAGMGRCEHGHEIPGSTQDREFIE